MLCLKAEVLDDHYPNRSNGTGDNSGGGGGGGFVLPINLGSSIHKYLRSISSWDSSPSSSSSVSDFEDSKHRNKRLGQVKGRHMSNYKYQLEQDVKKLQQQLQDEIHLRLALTNVVEHCDSSFSSSPCQLPDKAQELLDSLAILEITVSKLEQKSTALQYQLSQERNECRLAQYRLRNLPQPSFPPLVSSPAHLTKVLTMPCIGEVEGKIAEKPPGPNATKGMKRDHSVEKLLHDPNRLSEKMVMCMRDIFLFLSDSSELSSSTCLASSSPKGQISYSSLASFSDLPTMNSSTKRSSIDNNDCSDIFGRYCNFDPYRFPGKVDWTESIGSYSAAVEVSWLSAGKKQIEYACEALQIYRLLVEQLAEVNPSYLSSCEKLAFWINVYNALIMHAFLAYGVPASDIKLFSLMQKVAYNLGGSLLSAADIEYTILKMKPPVYRPQIALVLALQKFKVTEELKKFCIDQPEPLLMFALSCGMHSSPAVRIFRPENVYELLQDSQRDYIQASVGISEKNKLVVPRLLYHLAKGIVEDSQLPDWICQFLSPKQASVVRDCSSGRLRRLLGTRSFSVLPFDSRFRFLFLM